MPDDNVPQEPTPSETPAENAPAFQWPAVEPSPEPVQAPNPFMAPVSEPLPEVVAEPVVPETAPLEPTPQKSPKKKKMIIMGAIIVGALALLSGGAAAAYNLWYQNPEKVVLEAVGSLLQSGTSTHKLSVDIKTKDTTVTLTVDAKLAQSPASQADIAATITYGGKDYKVTGSTLTDKDGNLYFKVNDVKSLLTQLAGQGADFSAFNDVITKIDGQWVKVSSDDLKSVSAEYSKTQSCTTDALKKLDDTTVTKEITDLYKKNQFIIVGDKIGVRTIGGVASLGYKVTVDEAKTKAFYVGLGETSVGKALTACDSSFAFKASDLDTSSSSSASNNATTDVQVWSSRFGHQLTELDLNSKSNDTTTAIVWNPTFVKGVTVTAPSSSVPINDVVTMLENDYTSLYSSVYASDGATFSSDLTTQQNAFKLTSLL